MPDQSLIRALKTTLKDTKLSYQDMQRLTESTFDHGSVTREELSDLKYIYTNAKKFDPEERRLFMLQRFINHIDRRFANDKSAMFIPIRRTQLDPGSFRAVNTDLGGLFHGCFDVEYKPRDGEVVVSSAFPAN